MPRKCLELSRNLLHSDRINEWVQITQWNLVIFYSGHSDFIGSVVLINQLNQSSNKVLKLTVLC